MAGITMAIASVLLPCALLCFLGLLSVTLNVSHVGFRRARPYVLASALGATLTIAFLFLSI